MGHTNPGKYCLNIEVYPVADDNKRDVVLLAIAYELGKARPYLNMLAGEVLQAFYGLPDEPILPPIAFLNRDAVLSIGSLNTLPVTMSKGLSEKDAQIMPDNCPVEITLYQHS